ncbi:Hypothetical predicted protein [Scomber scombrus]|uniref:Secreted protein n=1 Tax=Scomber scombrus TaxID=13677 RepID=A0AAV1NPZ1_SCOSC
MFPLVVVVGVIGVEEKSTSRRENTARFGRKRKCADVKHFASPGSFLSQHRRGHVMHVKRRMELLTQICVKWSKRFRKKEEEKKQDGKND